VEWYEDEVQELEKARIDHPPPPRPAAFYGSSSIKLWTTLARDLGSECAVNLGFGGSTLEACLWFFERIVPPVRPASLVLYAGDNDLGDGRSPRDVEALFKALLRKVERFLGPVPFGYISIKPSLARLALLDPITQANAAIRKEITRRPTAFYVDVFDPMLGPDRHPRPELFVEDGLHLSPAGYQLWARLLEPYRDRIFTKDCGFGHMDVLPSRLDGP
jgi:lysophospholipase L1-like esterase